VQAENATGGWILYLPALTISLLILTAAGILGGPIAVAIAAMAVMPSLLLSLATTFLVLRRYTPSGRGAALGVGFGLYVSSVIVVIICLSLFGPSQIM
jgi:hypothetical protein